MLILICECLYRLLVKIGIGEFLYRLVVNIGICGI